MRISPIALTAVLTFAGAVQAEPAYEPNAFEAAPEAVLEEALEGVVNEAFTDEAVRNGNAPAEAAGLPASFDPSLPQEPGASEPTPAETVASAIASEASNAAGESASAQPAQAPARLGPIGYDSQGKPGRIHVVVGGDTLWDISDSYLGTPWVWPSIWKDNQAIANPHLIHPGDRIWITPNEMRKISAEEAEALLANAPLDAVVPASDAPPASFSDALAASTHANDSYRYTEIQTAGFVSSDRHDGAATILDSTVPRVWLGDHDEVQIGFGAQEVNVGDEFEIFRPMERVLDPETGKVLGWATNVMGWLKVKAVHDESATATIRLSRSEIRRGDHLLPRPPASPEIPVGVRPEVAGRIIYTPSWRTEMGTTDVVYLDRGAADGLEVGSPLEVFRPMGSERDALRGDVRALPDEVVAKLIVVQATPEAAVAVITHTRKELSRGDRFRGSDSIGP